jgi:serine/threonine-protein kinase
VLRRISDDDDEYDDDDVIERRSPLLPILFAVASAVVIVAAVVVALLFGGVIGGDEDGNPWRPPGGRTEVVPNFIGLDFEEISRTHGEKFLLIPSREHSPDFSVGTIMFQDVVAGQRVNPNRTPIHLTVSLGEQILIFPDFTADLMPGLDAVRFLEEMGLEVNTQQETHDTIPETFFTRSDRMPGDRISPGTRVTVFISLGPPFDPTKTNVPDMVNLTIGQAKTNATNMRLHLDEVPEESSEEMRGRVVRQSIDPHTEVQSWERITVWVGAGPVEIPPEPTNSSSISFTVGDIPREWEGVYEFLRIVDGEQVETRPLLVETGRTITWEFSNSGTKEYSIRIRNPRNGLEERYCVYEIDFSTNPPTRKETVTPDRNILEKLNPSQNIPDPPVTDEPYNPNEFPWNQ